VCHSEQRTQMRSQLCAPSRQSESSHAPVRVVNFTLHEPVALERKFSRMKIHQQ
jgi:hypothetical protein